MKPMYYIDLLLPVHVFWQICANWQGFFDPESGISYYMVSVGSEPLENVTDISNLTQVNKKSHEACVLLQPGFYLEHGKTYYTTVWAYNGAARQLNISTISNGGNLSYTY